MKRNVYYLIVLSICFVIPSSVLALSVPSNTSNIAVKKIGTVPLGTGASASQGIEVTDKYIVINESRPNDSTATTNAVQVVNKDDLSVYKTIIADDLGHGNDVVYNSVTNELYLLSGNNPTYRVYDSNTLTFKSNVKVPDLASISSIAYDSVNEIFYLHQYYQRLCYVTSNTFEAIRTFDTAPPTGYESQSFEFYDDNLYYTLINTPTADNGYKYTPAIIYVFVL